MGDGAGVEEKRGAWNTMFSRAMLDDGSGNGGVARSQCPGPGRGSAGWRRLPWRRLASLLLDGHGYATTIPP
eukprot:5761845-Pyramimonas_sp.AAC.1